MGDFTFSWSTSNGHGCTPVQYTVQVTDPVSGVLPLMSAGTATTLAFNTTTAACPYGTVNCNNPRKWNFQVRASSSGGTSAFTGAVSGTPRLGYNRDLVATIWGQASLGCTTCHNAAHTTNPLKLDGSQGGGPACTTNADCTYKSRHVPD